MGFSILAKIVLGGIVSNLKSEAPSPNQFIFRVKGLGFRVLDYIPRPSAQCLTEMTDWCPRIPYSKKLDSILLLGHSPLYKEHNFARPNHQKHPTLMNKLGSKSLGLRGLGFRV